MHVVLQSKLLDAAEYDEASSKLKLFMSNGQIREFCDVPDYVIADLKATASPGSYYMKLIRNRYPEASLG